MIVFDRSRGTPTLSYRLLPPQLLTPLHHSPQQILYFLPLPHEQGSLRPSFFSTLFGFGGFNRRSRAVISSGLSGSSAILYFQPLSLNRRLTSLSRASVCTCTTAGFVSVPS